MITKEEIQSLKEQYQKEIDYYNSIDFPILRGKFQTFVNFLDRIENEGYSIPTEPTEEEKKDENI
jgi:hypothetical protein